MTYGEFLTEFDDVIQVYGKEHFPQPLLDRTHYKIQDLTTSQLKELCCELIDRCKFAPKVPDILEFANIVRARHREGERQSYPADDGPRTHAVGKEALATITSILSKRRKP